MLFSFICWALSQFWVCFDGIHRVCWKAQMNFILKWGRGVKAMLWLWNGCGVTFWFTSTPLIHESSAHGCSSLGPGQLRKRRNHFLETPGPPGFLRCCFPGAKTSPMNLCVPHMKCFSTLVPEKTNSFRWWPANNPIIFICSSSSSWLWFGSFLRGRGSDVEQDK